MAHATSGGSNLYGVDWAGPPTGEFSIAGMSAAITTLAASIGPYTATNTSSKPAPSTSSMAPSSSSSPLPSRSHHKFSVGALAGIVCASIVAAMLIVGVVTCIRSRYQQRRAMDAFARRAALSLRLQVRVTLPSRSARDLTSRQSGRARSTLGRDAIRRNSISKDTTFELDEFGGQQG